MFSLHYRIKTAANDIGCGLHSGFPICCILYWQIHSFRSQRYKMLYARAYNGYSGWAHDPAPQPDWGRVPCPSCLLHKKHVLFQAKKCFCVEERPYKNRTLSGNVLFMFRQVINRANH